MFPSFHGVVQVARVDLRGYDACSGVGAPRVARGGTVSLGCSETLSRVASFGNKQRMNNHAAVHVEITKNSHAVLELALGQGLRRLARRELGLVGARRHEGSRRAEA